MGCGASKMRVGPLTVTSPITDLEPLKLEDRAYIERPSPELLRAANNAGRAPTVNFQSSTGAVGEPDLPEFLPSRRRKQDVFDPKEYQDVDKHAIELAQGHKKDSLKALTELLIAPHKEKGKLGAVRAIYRWLTAQDLSSISPDSQPQKDSVEWYLQKIRSDNQQYALVFMNMCRYAGIPCQEIRGNTKHAQLQPGEDPRNDNISYWAAVAMSGQWWLVDPHWGSSYTVNTLSCRELDTQHSDEKEKTVYNYHELYFFTDPEIMIYSHLPVEQKYQFLARPVTHEEFVEMPAIKSAFFEIGMKMMGETRYALQAVDGEVELKLGLPTEGQYTFMCELQSKNKDFSHDVDLKRFSLLHPYNGMLHCHVHLPKPEEYLLTIYGCSMSKQQYEQLCEYFIICDHASKKEPLPEIDIHEWGPGPVLTSAGLVPSSHPLYLVEAYMGEIEMTFRMTRAVDIDHIVTTDEDDDGIADEIHGCAVHYLEKEVVKLNVRLPTLKKEYALNIYCKDTENDDVNLTQVCSYLISLPELQFDTVPFPKISQVGAMAENINVGLELVSHTSPLIQCPDSGMAELLFATMVPCEISTTLEHCKPDFLMVNMDRHVWTKSSGTSFHYKICTPSPGWYVLTLHGKQLDENKDTLPEIFRCLVEVTVPCLSCLPQQMTSWKECDQLIEPEISCLAAKTRVKIGLSMAGMTSVMAIQQGTSTKLTSQGEDMWIGEVLTGNSGSTLEVQGTHNDDAHSTQTLLQYSVDTARNINTEFRDRRKQYTQAMADTKNRQSIVNKMEEVRKREKEQTIRALSSAMQLQDCVRLKQVLTLTEERLLMSEALAEYTNARDLLVTLTRVKGYNLFLYGLPGGFFAALNTTHEVRVPVFHVVRTTLRLLGFPTNATQNWSGCQQLLKSSNFMKSVKNFEIKRVHPDIAVEAVDLLSQYREQEILSANELAHVATAFHFWATGILEEMSKCWNRMDSVSHGDALHH